MSGIRWFIIVVVVFAVAFMVHPFLSKSLITAGQLDRLLTQQSSLEQFEATDAFIKGELQKTLNENPSAARIRVGLIHPSVNDSHLLRFDITHAATAPGHPVGELTSDHPITEWSDYLKQLMAKQCADVDISRVTSSISLQRMNSMTIRRFLACPIINQKSQMLGAVFMSWDANDVSPATQVELEAARRSLQTVAKTIAERASPAT